MRPLRALPRRCRTATTHQCRPCQLHESVQQRAVKTRAADPRGCGGPRGSATRVAGSRRVGPPTAPTPDRQSEFMNRFDDVRLDPAALLKAQDAKLTSPDPTARSGDGLGFLAELASIVRLYALGALIKLGVYRQLVYANIALGWFREFQRYWVDELGNRPIHPHDFYFLHGVYRQRLQTIHFEQIASSPSSALGRRGTLEAWRDPRTIYYLFAYTYRQALSPLRVHPFVRYIPRGGRVAEYGCGAAPILTALARRYRRLDLQLVGADIPHMLLHYARWCSRTATTMAGLDPDDRPAFVAFHERCSITPSRRRFEAMVARLRSAPRWSTGSAPDLCGAERVGQRHRSSGPRLPEARRGTGRPPGNAAPVALLIEQGADLIATILGVLKPGTSRAFDPSCARALLARRWPSRKPRCSLPATGPRREPASWPGRASRCSTSKNSMTGITRTSPCPSSPTTGRTSTSRRVQPDGRRVRSTRTAASCTTSCATRTASTSRRTTGSPCCRGRASAARRRACLPPSSTARVPTRSMSRRRGWAPSRRGWPARR